MSVSLTLQQEKIIISTGYQVVSKIIAAEPTSMFPVFVVKAGADLWNEVYGGVADLTDLALWEENPLIKFTDTVAGALGLPNVGQTIKVTAGAPLEWFDSSFTLAEFTIVTKIDVNSVLVQADKPFPTATAGLTWQVKENPSINGTDGYTSREDASKDTFLRRHFTSLLANVSKAESRVASIKAGVQSLANASNVHGVTFEGIETTTYNS